MNCDVSGTDVKSSRHSLATTSSPASALDPKRNFHEILCSRSRSVNCDRRNFQFASLTSRHLLLDFHLLASTLSSGSLKGRDSVRNLKTLTRCRPRHTRRTRRIVRNLNEQKLLRTGTTHRVRTAGENLTFRTQTL